MRDWLTHAGLYQIGQKAGSNSRPNVDVCSSYFRKPEPRTARRVITFVNSIVKVALVKKKVSCCLGVWREEGGCVEQKALSGVMMMMMRGNEIKCSRQQKMFTLRGFLKQI